jgi:hypothetical protein
MIGRAGRRQKFGSAWQKNCQKCSAAETICGKLSKNLLANVKFTDFSNFLKFTWPWFCRQATNREKAGLKAAGI